MRVVAFSIGHDSSVCSIKDGAVEFFCKEERLSRKKRDSSPLLSLNLFKSLNLGRIDKALYHEQNSRNTSFNIYNGFFKEHFNISVEKFSHLNHHLCHATLAFYNSKYKESLVYIADRTGSVLYNEGGIPIAAETESLYYFRENHAPKIIYKNFITTDSCKYDNNGLIKLIQDQYGSKFDITFSGKVGLVNVYEAATSLIGQHELENGKTMGLSSYGEYDPETCLFKNNLPNNELFELAVAPGKSNLTFHFKDHLHLINNSVNETNYQYYANKAKQVQVETQDNVFLCLSKYLKKFNTSRVCLSGGYALNIVSNGNLIKKLPHVNFFFEPVSDDTGISIGAAIAGYNKLNNFKPIVPVVLPKDNFFHYYKQEETVNEGQLATIDTICNLLMEQKSIAIFEGNPEVGPRALGHRSILFDPRNKNAKHIINKVKKREWYRPFAGIILEEEFQKYFHTHGLTGSEYMTINFECKEVAQNIAPGIIHVDNTCRIQTVSQGFIYDILTRFYEKTGCPIIMNTSFNLAGEALVQTKEDALKTLYSSSLDGVFFVQESKLILKKEVNDC